MGFGLLLIGYIIAYVAAIGFGPYMFAGTLIGGFIMFLGLSELRRYAPTFVYPIRFCLSARFTELSFGSKHSSPLISE